MFYIISVLTETPLIHNVPHDLLKFVTINLDLTKLGTLFTNIIMDHTRWPGVLRGRQIFYLCGSDMFVCLVQTSLKTVAFRTNCFNATGHLTKIAVNSRSFLRASFFVFILTFFTEYALFGSQTFLHFRPIR